MTDENKNIGNNQEENQNRQECNKKWWKNVGLKPIYGIFCVLIGFILYYNIAAESNIVYNFLKYTYEINSRNTCKIDKIFTKKSNNINILENNILNNIDIEYIKVKSMNIPRYLPTLISLKNGKILVYGSEDTFNTYPKLKQQKYNPQYTYPEIFDIKTKSFKTLPILKYKLGDIYYELKDGNLLFFDDFQVTLFDIKNETFRKFAEGIKEIKETKRNANPSFCNIYLIPYSDNFIFISSIGTKKNYDKINVNYEIEWLIKYNIKSKTYKKIDFKKPVNFTNYIVINKQVIFISEKSSDIYIYNIELNKFIKKGSLIFKEKEISLRKVSNNQVLVLSHFNKKPIQMITLSPFKVETLSNINLLATDFYNSKYGCILTNNYLIFSSGLIFDKTNNNFIQGFNPREKGCIAKLSDELFLIVGTDQIKIPTRTAIIIKI